VRISAKADYAVRAAIELARNEDGPTKGTAIAAAQAIPLKFLENILIDMRHAGLVRSQRGAEGGYWLARPAEEITMDEVVQALEGAISPMECFTDPHTQRVVCSHTDDAGRCATKLLWTRVQGGIVRALHDTTLADLVEFSRHELAV
jgi:Rrf2 family transcriptional regulator, cysteine metabolism repressor